MRVYARARGRDVIGIFTIRIGCSRLLFRGWVFSRSLPFIENNTSFSSKQHVVFLKTTRRFPQNNTSFEEKERIVLWRIGIQNFIAHTASTLRGTFRNDKALKNVQKMGQFKENHYLCTK